MSQIRPSVRRTVPAPPRINRAPEPPQINRGPAQPNVSKTVRKLQTRYFGKGPIQWILYSGTAETENEPNLESLYKKDLPQYVQEVSVRHGKKVLATHTHEYGFKSDLIKLYYDMLMYRGKIGEKAFSLSVYKSGKITFTGGYPEGSQSMSIAPRSLVRRIIGNFKNFIVKSATVQFDSKLMMRRDKLATGAYDYDVQSVVTQLLKMGIPISNISYPERNPLEPIQTKPFISIKVSQQIIRIFPNGQVQLVKITSDSMARKLLGDSRLLMRRIKMSGAMIPREDVIPKSRLTRPQLRKKNDIAPNISTRSTTCPENKRPHPYSFSGVPIGPNYYIGVNPQGMPCCYKIPKKTAYLKQKIIDRFKELGIQIPQSTKQAFGIQLNNSNLPKNVSGKEPDLPIFIDERGQLKIGTRQAKRWPLVKLVDIARKLGAVYISYKSSKDDVIQAIIKESKTKDKFNVENSMRIEGKRNIRHFTKSNLVKRVLKVYGVRLNNQQSMKNLLDSVKRLQNKARFKKLYNTIMPINRIPDEFKNTFYTSARNNYMGLPNANIKRGLEQARNQVLEILRGTQASP